MQLSMIVAMAANRCIGRDNRMPWHLPADLAHFKRSTMGCPVIMGRKTFESILASLGKPLPGRTSVIVSRNPAYRPPQMDAALAQTLRVVVSPNAAWEAARACGTPEAFIIGGAEIYRAMLPATQRLVVTEIHQDFDGDAFFPSIDAESWQQVARIAQPRSGRPEVDFDFVEYKRRTPS
jgi:dihydrofolate reductase